MLAAFAMCTYMMPSYKVLDWYPVVQRNVTEVHQEAAMFAHWTTGNPVQILRGVCRQAIRCSPRGLAVTMGAVKNSKAITEAIISLTDAR